MHQVGFIYKIIQRCTVNKTHNVACRLLVLIRKPTFSYLVNSQIFVKTEVLFLHFQARSTCLYQRVVNPAYVFPYPFFRSILQFITLCLPSGLHSSGFPTKTLHSYIFFIIRAIGKAHLICLDLVTNNIWWKLQIMKLLIMQFSTVFCYTSPFRIKVLQQPLL